MVTNHLVVVSTLLVTYTIMEADPKKNTYSLSRKYRENYLILQDLFEFSDVGSLRSLVLNSKISCNISQLYLCLLGKKRGFFFKTVSNNNRWVQYMIFRHIWLTHNRGIIQRRAERRVLVCIILCRCCRGIFSYICSHPL